MQAYENDEVLSSEEQAKAEQERRAEIAEKYSIYEPYGMTYDTEKDRFFYNGQVVRYFKDQINSNETNGFSFPQMEMDKLCVVDHYPSDRFTFSSHGYDLHIENELVADAFAGLSVQEQSILILHFVLDLPDQEVGRLVGMSRSAVQRRRANSLAELRIKLAALMPKGG